MRMLAVGCINVNRFSAVSEFTRRHREDVDNDTVGLDFITRPDGPGFDRIVGVLLYRMEVPRAN